MRRLRFLLAAAALLGGMGMWGDTSVAAPPARVSVGLTSSGCTLSATASWTDPAGTFVYVDFLARTGRHVDNYRVVASVTGMTATASATFPAAADGSMKTFWARAWVRTGSVEDSAATAVAVGGSTRVRVPCEGLNN